MYEYMKFLDFVLYSIEYRLQHPNVFWNQRCKCFINITVYMKMLEQKQKVIYMNEDGFIYSIAFFF